MIEKLSRYFGIVWYRTSAQLKSESRQNYLGYLWFLFEPLLMTLTLYLVFGVLVSSKGPSFALFILVGMMVWQWFEVGVMEGLMGVRSKLHIMSQIPLPKFLFPWVHVATATCRFLFLFAVVVGLAVVLGHPPSWAYLALLPLMLVQMLLIGGIALCLTIFVAYFGDLARVVSAFMRFLFYLSGVFYASSVVPEHLLPYFKLNPVALLIEDFRAILIDAAFPSVSSMVYVLLIALVLNALGLMTCVKFDKKLLKSVSL